MSLDTIRDVYSYDPETGVFCRLVQVKWNAPAGPVFGRLDSKGYRQICHAGKRYFAHRLAWWFVHGEMPSGDLDHINGDPTDNRIANLRCVTKAINMRNRRVPLPSGRVPGVQPKYGKWHVSINVEAGKQRFLGTFDDFEAAVLVRREFEDAYGYTDRHGRAA